MEIGPLKLKAQMLCGDEIAMGPGKADLLDAIDREGSISAAARTLGMSYRRAWLLVDAMNRSFTARLVEAHVGGGRSAGAVLTPAGRDALLSYRALQRAVASAAAPFASPLAAMLRKRPAPASAADAKLVES